jgi:hypothetical protein
MMPKKALLDVGLYSEQYNMSDDYEMIFKMGKI